MSLTSESNIEIEATISISNNDFTYTCNVSPVPELTSFDNVKVYYKMGSQGVNYCFKKA